MVCQKDIVVNHLKILVLKKYYLNVCALKKKENLKKISKKRQINPEFLKIIQAMSYEKFFLEFLRMIVIIRTNNIRNITIIFHVDHSMQN